MLNKQLITLAPFLHGITLLWPSQIAAKAVTSHNFNGGASKFSTLNSHISLKQ